MGERRQSEATKSEKSLAFLSLASVARALLLLTVLVTKACSSSCARSSTRWRRSASLTIIILGQPGQPPWLGEALCRQAACFRLSMNEKGPMEMMSGLKEEESERERHIKGGGLWAFICATRATACRERSKRRPSCFVRGGRLSPKATNTTTVPTQQRYVLSLACFFCTVLYLQTMDGFLHMFGLFGSSLFSYPPHSPFEPLPPHSVLFPPPPFSPPPACWATATSMPTVTGS